MNNAVFARDLKSEMRELGRRDCWFIARNLVENANPQTVATIQAIMHFDPEGQYRVRHADESDAPVECWREVKTTQREAAQNRASAPKPNAPLAKPLAPKLTLLAGRIRTCEQQQAELSQVLQRLVEDVSAIKTSYHGRQAEMGVLREQLQELSDQMCRNEYEIAGIRFKQLGGAA